MLIFDHSTSVMKGLLKVFFKDGTFKTFAVTEETTAKDVCEMFGKKMRISGRYFELFEVRNGRERKLQLHEKPLQIVRESSTAVPPFGDSRYNGFVCTLKEETVRSLREKIKSRRFKLANVFKSPRPNRASTTSVSPPAPKSSTPPEQPTKHSTMPISTTSPSSEPVNIQPVSSSSPKKKFPFRFMSTNLSGQSQSAPNLQVTSTPLKTGGNQSVRPSSIKPTNSTTSTNSTTPTNSTIYNSNNSNTTNNTMNNNGTREKRESRDSGKWGYSSLIEQEKQQQAENQLMLELEGLKTSLAGDSVKFRNRSRTTPVNLKYPTNQLNHPQNFVPPPMPTAKSSDQLVTSNQAVTSPLVRNRSSSSDSLLNISNQMMNEQNSFLANSQFVKYSIDEVCAWLQSEGMSEYEQIFREEAIDGYALSLLKEDDLKSLGVKLGHRKKILSKIHPVPTSPTKSAVSTDESDLDELIVRLAQLTSEETLQTLESADIDDFLTLLSKQIDS